MIKEKNIIDIADDDISKAVKAIQKGYLIDGYNETGMTPLQKAAMYGYTEMVKFLLNVGATVDRTDQDYASTKGQHGFNTTALMFAAQGGHTDVVEILIKHGADVNHQDSRRWTALMTSSKNGYKDTVDLLLKHGARVGIFNNNYDTAISLAKRFGQAEIAAKLKEAHDNNESNIFPAIAELEQKIKAIEEKYNSKINCRYLTADGTYA